MCLVAGVGVTQTKLPDNNPWSNHRIGHADSIICAAHTQSPTHTHSTCIYTVPALLSHTHSGIMTAYPVPLYMTYPCTSNTENDISEITGVVIRGDADSIICAAHTVPT